MSSTQVSHEKSSSTATAAAVDLKLEVVVLPVTDVDRAKRFYEGLGWRLDADFAGEDWRAIQFTPPGSPCSIHFGKKVTTAVPGSVQGLYLVVDDLVAARADLIARGADVSEPFHYAGILGERLPGLHPERQSYGSYATFADPDGNTWKLQEIKTRFPGRGLSHDLPTLTALLRDAEDRHGENEATVPKHHWSEWYGTYMVARERGKTVEDAVNEANVHVGGARG